MASKRRVIDRRSASEKAVQRFDKGGPVLTPGAANYMENEHSPFLFTPSEVEAAKINKPHAEAYKFDLDTGEVHHDVPDAGDHRPEAGGVGAANYSDNAHLPNSLGISERTQIDQAAATSPDARSLMAREAAIAKAKAVKRAKR